MRTSVERTGILAASSWMKGDGMENDQPITVLEELQVGGWLFCLCLRARLVDLTLH